MATNNIVNLNGKKRFESELLHHTVSNQCSLLKLGMNTKYPTSLIKSSPASGSKSILIQTIRKENLKTIIKPQEKMRSSSISLKPKVILPHTSTKLITKGCKIPGIKVVTQSLMKKNNTPSIMTYTLMSQEQIKLPSNKVHITAEKHILSKCNSNKLLLGNEKTSSPNSILPGSGDLNFSNRYKQTEKGSKIVNIKLTTTPENSQSSLVKVNKTSDDVRAKNYNVVPGNHDINYHKAQEKSLLKNNNYKLHVAKTIEKQVTLLEEKTNVQNKVNPFVYSSPDKQAKTNKTEIEKNNQTFPLINQFNISKDTPRLFKLEEEVLENQKNNRVKCLNYTSLPDANINKTNITSPNSNVCSRFEKTRIGTIPNNCNGIPPHILRRLYGECSNDTINTFEVTSSNEQPSHMALEKPANTELWCMRKPNDPILAGYNPLRGDFSIEYDNSAEELPIIAGKLVDCSKGERSKDDLKLIKEVAVTLTKAYNRRLSERNRRKEVIKSFGLMNQRGAKACFSRHEVSLGKSVFKKSMKFFQIFTPDQIELLFHSLAITNEVKSYLNKLIFYRSQHGIKTLLDKNIFERERCKDEVGHTRFNVRNVALPSAQKRRIVTQIFHLPRYKDLSVKEAELCSSMRLTPELFLKAKDNLLVECKRNNGLLLKTARKLVKIDVNKTRKIFDLLMENGSIWPPDDY